MGREELVLLLASLFPGNASGDRSGVRLLHTEPSMLQGLFLVTDVAEPVILFTARDTVRLRKDTWKEGCIHQSAD